MSDSEPGSQQEIQQQQQFQGDPSEEALHARSANVEPPQNTHGAQEIGRIEEPALNQSVHHPLLNSAEVSQIGWYLRTCVLFAVHTCMKES